MACWGAAAKGAAKGAATGAFSGAVAGGVGAVPGAIIGGVAGGIGGLFSGECKVDDKERDFINRQAAAHNIFLDDYEDYASFAHDALKAGGYDPFGPQITTRAGTSSSRTQFDETSTETPTITAEYTPLAQMQRSLVEKRLASPTSLPAGYTEAGVQAINQAAEGALAARANFARNRGISEDVLKIGDPNERARNQQIAQFRVETPLKERELRTQDIGLAQNLIAAFGRGSTGRRSGSSSTTGSTFDTMTAPPDYATAIGVFGPQGPRAPGVTPQNKKEKGVSALEEELLRQRRAAKGLPVQAVPARN